MFCQRKEPSPAPAVAHGGPWCAHGATLALSWAFPRAPVLESAMSDMMTQGRLGTCPGEIETESE